MSRQFPWRAETARDRLVDLKHRVESDDPALKSVFTQIFFQQAEKQCGQLHTHSDSPLCGAMVSIKDLFDVKHFVTRAGTKFMAEDPPASADAPPVKSLREAGAIITGHTNMTELAYSGLGLNPHYGTPENALYRGCIPGGSTAGGAVSVAHGITDIAIGTDTGGSLRIPAAFNGIVGFKPTQSTVSRNGCKALSRSLDSVGPMARTVAACDIAYQTISGTACKSGLPVDKEFIIPTNYGMDDLEAPVKTAFEQAVIKLKDCGYKVERKPVKALDTLKSLAIWHFSSIESRAEYEQAYQTKKQIMDPRVAGPTRMGRADEVDAITYRQTLNMRRELIELYREEIGNRVLLMPTVPILPPTLKSMADDDEYSRVNLQVLRNPSIANVMDCCSISLPFAHVDTTIGIMMTATANHDLSLLELASACEHSFSKQAPL